MDPLDTIMLVKGSHRLGRHEHIPALFGAKDVAAVEDWLIDLLSAGLTFLYVAFIGELCYGTSPSFRGFCILFINSSLLH